MPLMTIPSQISWIIPWNHLDLFMFYEHPNTLLIYVTFFVNKISEATKNLGNTSLFFFR